MSSKELISVPHLPIPEGAEKTDLRYHEYVEVRSKARMISGLFESLINDLKPLGDKPAGSGRSLVLLGYSQHDGYELAQMIANTLPEGPQLDKNVKVLEDGTASKGQWASFHYEKDGSIRVEAGHSRDKSWLPFRHYPLGPDPIINFTPEEVIQRLPHPFDRTAFQLGLTVGFTLDSRFNSYVGNEPASRVMEQLQTLKDSMDYLLKLGENLSSFNGQPRPGYANVAPDPDLGPEQVVQRRRARNEQRPARAAHAGIEGGQNDVEAGREIVPVR